MPRSEGGAVRGPRVGPYAVHLADFEATALPLLSAVRGRVNLYDNQRADVPIWFAAIICLFFFEVEHSMIFQYPNSGVLSA